MVVEIDSIHGSKQRMIFYRVTDDVGGIHSYGPVITIDPEFDPEAHKSVVLAKMQESLAAQEFDALLGAGD